jgi:hypothetical protein
MAGDTRRPTTAAQVKKMARPLLERHPDLALVGRWIYVNRFIISRALGARTGTLATQRVAEQHRL